MAVSRTPRVSVRVEYTQGEREIQSVDFGNTYSAMSGYKGTDYIANNTLSTVSSGGNPFILGKSKLGSGAKYTSSYDGYISNIRSTSTYYNNDATKGYVIPNGGIRIEITRKTNPITTLSLFFDKVVKEYPVVIDVTYNHKTISYENTSYEMFTWADGDCLEKTIVITLKSWSTPNSVIRLTGLLDELTMTYDRSNGLAGLSIKIQSTTSDMPEYGCIGKTDSMKICDKSYTIQKMAERGLLDKKVPVSVLINNNLVCKYKTASDWDVNGNEISVSLEDEIMGWSDIQLDLSDPPYKYIGVGEFDRSLYVENLWELIVATLVTAGVDVDDGSYLGRIETTRGVRSRLSSIQLGVWYQPTQLTLTQFINNACMLGQVNIYIGLKDKIVISEI